MSVHPHTAGEPTCNQQRRERNLPTPRTCQQCGLGPCRTQAAVVAQQDDIVVRVLLDAQAFDALVQGKVMRFYPTPGLAVDVMMSDIGWNRMCEGIEAAIKEAAAKQAVQLESRTARFHKYP